MCTAKIVVQLLNDTERRLRELVGMAASEGDYDAVARIAEWARTVGVLAREGQAALRPLSEPGLSLGGAESVAQSESPCTAQLNDDPPPAHGEPVRARAGPVTSSRRRAPAKGEYPKFFRRGDQLVKIGWSKKEREEYEHKAPRQVADALAAAIARRSAGGKPFTTEQIFPLTDPRDGSEIPGYQGYVALAWFKSAGLVKQNGRSDYVAKKTENFGDIVDTAWLRLTERVE